MVTLTGIGASKGIGIGKVFIMKERNRVIKKSPIKSIEEEIQRIDDARQEAISQLAELQEKAKVNIGEDEAAIFEVHQMMLEDQDFIGRIAEIITEQRVNAEYAVESTKEEYSALFASMDDSYMQERAADIADISQRVIDILMGNVDQSLADIKEKSIIVAPDLLPSDTVTMVKESVLGILTEQGGVTSHSSILARTMQIPAVVGVQDLLTTIKSGDEVILDGESGKVLINPNQETKTKWEQKQKEYFARREQLQKLIGTESITKDGFKVQIAANIGVPDDVEAVLENDGEGIGLFRSEFLYMHGDSAPDEETQYKAYKTVLEKMEGEPVIIRTLDVGGDKEIPYLHIAQEDNPFLGYRAIRVSLEQTDIFKIQLRALLRASIHGNLGIMFPMISTVDELRRAKEIVEEVKQNLIKEKIPFSSDFEVGVMIEVPAAAMISDLLAKEVDFFSIGTNDLTQYTMAADRMNAKVAHLYDTHHPAVLRLIKKTIENGHRENIWVGICGEAGSDLSLTETFVAMGIDELSVNAGSILEVREKVQNINYQDAKTKLKI